MMMSKLLVVVSLLAVPGSADKQTLASESSLNPIRKVVTMLQSMQKKVEQEGEKEKDLYQKFMCYCKTGGGDLGSSISAAEDKIPSVTSDIEAAEAKMSQAKETLKQAQVDRAAAKGAMADATALREKEAKTYADYKSEADTNVAAIAKAVAALEKGMAGSFLQSPAAVTLKRAVSSSGITESDQETITAFLTQSTSYAPQSGDITGILKQMGDTMAANLADTTSVEEKAIQAYKELMAAKTKEVNALTDKVEAKTHQIGELGVDIVQMKEDLADTGAALKEDQKFLAELEKSCATKTAEWEERSKTRSEELVALADTIKVLNDDDALELFKKTLPSPSLVQVRVTTSEVRTRALATLRQARQKANQRDLPGLELLALALAGKQQGGFDKVIKMIDNMVDVLQKEQRDDNDKKEYCGLQFDHSDDKKKELERTIEQADNAITVAKESIATLTQEIAGLTAGIKKLDTSVAEATEMRRAENAEFKELIASDTAATEVLAFAKNRLNKFYNPKLYKAPPKRELSAENRIVENFGGDVPTVAPGGIAGTGITAFAQVRAHVQRKDAPAPPPTTWKAYAKKGGESTGVIAMIDLLIADLAKEMTEAKTEEKDSQADYEQMMKDAADKRTTDSKSLAEKTSAKADTEVALGAEKEHKAATGKELMATMKYISSLHAECDWLIQYFDVRKTARNDEIDSLKKAKAVLSGADYSLVQTRSQRFLARHA
jgi:hypothetical protein